MPGVPKSAWHIRESKSVDPYSNSNAYRLFARDIDNLCAYFRKYGLEYDSYRLANAVWNGREY